jgi:hypothetical protein
MPPILILTRLQTGYVAGDPEFLIPSSCMFRLSDYGSPFDPRFDSLFTLDQVVDRNNLDFPKRRKAQIQRQSFNVTV